MLISFYGVGQTKSSASSHGIEEESYIIVGGNTKDGRAGGILLEAGGQTTQVGGNISINAGIPSDFLASKIGNIYMSAQKFTFNTDTGIDGIDNRFLKFGIGTTNPQETLEVNGNINLGINSQNVTTRSYTYGAKLNFLGANDNGVPIYLSRYNVKENESDLRVVFEYAKKSRFVVGQNDAAAGSDYISPTFVESDY